MAGNFWRSYNNRYQDNYTVYSAEDQEKRTILKFQEEMLEAMTEYTSYELAHVNKSLTKELFQASVLKLYHKLRSHISKYYERKNTALLTAERRKKKYAQEELRNIKESCQQASEFIRRMDGGYKDLINADYLLSCVKFLNLFILEYGISRIERETGDPLRDYSEQAYGQDYDDEEKTEESK